MRAPPFLRPLGLFLAAPLAALWVVPLGEKGGGTRCSASLSPPTSPPRLALLGCSTVGKGGGGEGKEGEPPYECGALSPSAHTFSAALSPPPPPPPRVVRAAPTTPRAPRGVSLCLVEAERSGAACGLPGPSAAGECSPFPSPLLLPSTGRAPRSSSSFHTHPPLPVGVGNGSFGGSLRSPHSPGRGGGDWEPLMICGVFFPAQGLWGLLTIRGGPFHLSQSPGRRL